MPKVIGKQQSLIAVGAYIFAGGFSLGVSKHFQIACHLEESDYGVKTVRRNFPDLPVYVGIPDWPMEELVEYDIDFIYGNPPCAAWSQNGAQNKAGVERWRTDPRVDCTRRHFSLMVDLKPKVWAWESVTQAYLKGQEFVQGLTRQALDLGYSVSHILHDSMWLNLPQVRPRYFMVCHNIEFTPVMPDWSKPKTCLEALNEVPQAANGELLWCRPLHKRQFEGRLEIVRPGESLASAWERELAPPEPWEKNTQGGVKGRPSVCNYRLHPDRPARVSAGNFVVIHPTEHRPITFEEQKHLSGFPIDYDFGQQSLSARQQELSRGVCPPVGEWLARGVANSIRCNVPVGEPRVILYDLRKPGIDPVDLTEEHNAEGK